MTPKSGETGVLTRFLSHQRPQPFRLSAAPGSTRALARGAVRLARRFGSSRFIGEAPMKTAEAAVLPGTGNRPYVQAESML